MEECALVLKCLHQEMTCHLSMVKALVSPDTHLLTDPEVQSFYIPTRKGKERKNWYLVASSTTSPKTHPV